ncbi:MAG: glucosamine-6-phosphate deaminase [Erysipelotrichaceae bacterium]|nr:MAG: glucosamine-6-phosphate [Erysipelotrichaceae bacterium]TXT18997.1 MAG: glucosamine-6-phosphate deaminase [Erysipelotrichaceae bacterium]
MFKIFVYKTYDEVSQKAFEILKDIIKVDHPITLGLATGSSPVGLYARLVEDHIKNKTSYAHVTTYNLDEYVGLPKGHLQSYLTFMNQHLFDYIDCPRNQIHMPEVHVDDLKAAADAYSAAVLTAKPDVQVLGIGSNGHIGFNEPGTSFSSTTHVVGLKEETRLDNARFFSGLDEVPRYAVSMGITEIMSAKKIVLIATGNKKALAVKEMIHGKIREEVPCTILQKHQDVVLILDEEAARLLND